MSVHPQLSLSQILIAKCYIPKCFVFIYHVAKNSYQGRWILFLIFAKKKIDLFEKKQ